MGTYTAITIGPIYKTFSQVRKSRELWGASYLFSYITKSIVDKISNVPCLPYSPNLANAKGKGAGFFPDRIIFEGDIKNEVEKVVKITINDIATHSGLPEEYLNHYLRTSVLTFSLPSNVYSEADKEKNKNIVIVANSLLDTAELQEKYYQDISKIQWREAIDKLNGKLFYKKAFKKHDEFEFPSLIEIATDDFRQKNEKEYDRLVNTILNKKLLQKASKEKQEQQDKINQENFINALKKNDAFYPLDFSPYHKYVAVVEADGDNIGATIGAVGTDSAAIRDFSSALFDFSVEATETISRYGGKPVYSGGDDLLFFAPVAVYTTGHKEAHLRSIFALLKEIDNVFQKKIVQNDKLKHLYESEGISKPSMSFGVSIGYYKFPLNETRDCAHQMLTQIKAVTDKTDKNKIHFRMQKHSGQSFKAIVDKKKTSYDHFLKTVEKIPLDAELLTSIIHKLAPMSALLAQIADKKERLEQFFAQEFEIEIDRTLPNKNAREVFIWHVVDYYHQLATDFPNDNKMLQDNHTEQDESNIGKLYYVLRFLKHLISEEDE
ncbi:type III-B CRISPR-associated protein Cas10/Cmr2 [Bacteroidia bacterium]|nr:type III-B CRISPR-associated protein Cas10/Cmr2 [Bacteroidia bacterium]GHV08817.1 type III-B CRISPR-associated protein Cas10/Cmr2 [Bacteroidia bacterium]